MKRINSIFGNKIILFVLLFLLQLSCKKMDTLKENDSVIINTDRFFALPANTDPVVRRLADEMKKRNEKKEFVKEFIRRNGYPVWDKALTASSPAAANFSQQNTEAGDTLITLPLVNEEKRMVTGFISARINGEIDLDLYRGTDYSMYSFNDTPGNSINADKAVSQILYLNYLVYGYSDFWIKDDRLFSNAQTAGDSTDMRLVKFKIPASASINLQTPIEITSCVDIYEPGPCPGTNVQSTAPGGSVSRPGGCMIYAGEACTTYVIYIIGGGGGSGGGSTGGTTGSGGGSPQSPFPCPSSQVGIIPIPDCDLMGTDPIETLDPEVASAMFDTYWMNNNFKDSTSNTCTAGVVNKLTSISNKLPTLIRTFFGQNASLKITLRQEYKDTWNGGQGPNVAYVDNLNFQMGRDTFSIYMNNYFDHATDLIRAATIMHEALHCQLLRWYDEAVLQNDTLRQQQLARDYGYLFSGVFSGNSSLAAIVLGLNPTQHQDMVTRYNATLSSALYEFALAKGFSPGASTRDYCSDLIWSGCTRTPAFMALSNERKDRILKRIGAELDPDGLLDDPTGFYHINNGGNPKGHKCN